MAVYGRIEEVSETIQSNEIENRLDRNLESHVRKRRTGSFSIFQTHHLEVRLQRFFLWCYLYF